MASRTKSRLKLSNERLLAVRTHFDKQAWPDIYCWIVFSFIQHYTSWCVGMLCPNYTFHFFELHLSRALSSLPSLALVGPSSSSPAAELPAEVPCCGHQGGMDFSLTHTHTSPSCIEELFASQKSPENTKNFNCHLYCKKHTKCL